MTDEMNEMARAYTEVGEELARRILALIPQNPGILEMEEPFDLFKIEGFQCRDLSPSLFQADWALGKAKRMYKERDIT